MGPGLRRSLETGSGNCQERRNIVFPSLSPLSLSLVFTCSLPAGWLALPLSPHGISWSHHVPQFSYLLHPKADPRMRVESLSPNSKFPGEENLISPVWARCLFWSHRRRQDHMAQTETAHPIAEDEV